MPIAERRWWRRVTRCVVPSMLDCSSAEAMRSLNGSWVVTLLSSDARERDAHHAACGQDRDCYLVADLAFIPVALDPLR